MSSLLALYPVVRGVIFIGVLFLIGTAAARALLTKATEDLTLRAELKRRIASPLPTITLLLALAILARGALQVLTFADPGDPVDWPLIHGAILSGSWGWAWMTQAAAATLLALLFRTAAARSAGWLLLLVLIVGAQTRMGHPAGNQWPGPVGELLDGLHLVGGGLWLGTLAVLGSTVIHRLRSDQFRPVLATLVERYSRFARLGVVLIVVSGVAETLVYARSLSLFVHSAWGQLLIIKLVAMAGVMGLGWYNWKVVTPALAAPTGPAAQRLQRAVQIELALGVVMLAITALLVVNALPGES